MEKLRKGLERTFLSFNKIPDSEVERIDKEVTVLTVQFSKNGTKHVTNINERPQVEPEYCRRCGGIENLFSLFPSSSYEGVVTIAQYGCECL